MKISNVNLIIKRFRFRFRFWFSFHVVEKWFFFFLSSIDFQIKTNDRVSEWFFLHFFIPLCGMTNCHAQDNPNNFFFFFYVIRRCLSRSFVVGVLLLTIVTKLRKYNLRLFYFANKNMKWHDEERMFCQFHRGQTEKETNFELNRKMSRKPKEVLRKMGNNWNEEKKKEVWLHRLRAF